MSQTGNTGIAIVRVGADSLEAKLPPKATFSAYWMPIFLEPIVLSGERLCIGVAAISSTGEAATAMALQEEALRCILGRKNADSLLSIAKIALEDCQTFLASGGWLTHWRPPFDGIRPGGPLPAASRFGMAGVLRQGLSRSACLSALLLDPKEESESERREAEEDRWPKQVRAAVQQSAPQLAQHFGKDFSVIKGARKTPIDFIGHKLAAGLGKLVPTGQQLSRNIKDAKVKLWNLDSLRSHHGDIFPLAHYELLLYRPEDSNPDYSDRQIAALHEALLELTEEADRHEIRVLHYTTAEAAAARIIYQEAA